MFCAIKVIGFTISFLLESIVDPEAFFCVPGFSPKLAQMNGKLKLLRTSCEFCQSFNPTNARSADIAAGSMSWRRLVIRPSWLNFSDMGALYFLSSSIALLYGQKTQFLGTKWKREKMSRKCQLLVKYGSTSRGHGRICGLSGLF